MAQSKLSLDQQAHIVTVGVPDAYLGRFRKNGFPNVKTAEYPNFPIFEIYECTHPRDGVLRVREWTQLVILDLISNVGSPFIPLARQVEQVQRVFPNARVWCITDTEEDVVKLSCEGELDLQLAERIIGFTPYVNDAGESLDPTVFYRNAVRLAFPYKFSY